MKKQTRNYAMAAAVATLPVLRAIDDHCPPLVILLCVAVCLYFLLRGLYLHMLEHEGGRAFLQKIPFLHVPEKDQE